MVTAIEVVDTAVKVGLGALISGLSAYALAQRHARLDQARARLNRRDELLELVAESVQSFSQTFLLYWARVADAAAAHRKNETLSVQVQEAVISARESLFREVETLNAAEARLLLLGEKEGQARLRALNVCAMEVRAKTSLREAPPAEADLENMRDEFLGKRDLLFERLAQVYGSQTV